MSEWVDRSGQEPGQAGAQCEGGVPADRRLDGLPNGAQVPVAG